MNESKLNKVFKKFWLWSFLYDEKLLFFGYQNRLPYLMSMFGALNISVLVLLFFRIVFTFFEVSKGVKLVVWSFVFLATLIFIVFSWVRLSRMEEYERSYYNCKKVKHEILKVIFIQVGFIVFGFVGIVSLGFMLLGFGLL